MDTEERYAGITTYERERGQTVHIMEALEQGQITPEEFATIRAEIVRCPSLLRFVKSIMCGPAPPRVSANGSVREKSPQIG